MKYALSPPEVVPVKVRPIRVVPGVLGKVTDNALLALVENVKLDGVKVSPLLELGMRIRPPCVGAPFGLTFNTTIEPAMTLVGRASMVTLLGVFPV